MKRSSDRYLMKVLKTLKPGEMIVEGENAITCTTDSGAAFTLDGIKRGNVVFVNGKPAGCVKHSTETALTLTKWHIRYPLAWITWALVKVERFVCMWTLSRRG